MWKCIRFGAEFGADEAEANVDSFGLHFTSARPSGLVTSAPGRSRT